MRPRFRTVVKPASRVVRALTVARNVRKTGSSWTPCTARRTADAVFGPPRTRLISMSIRPGSNVTSPRSISPAGDGTSRGFTAAMRLPSTTTTAGVRTSPASTSTHRSARRTVVSLTSPLQAPSAPGRWAPLPLAWRLARSWHRLHDAGEVRRSAVGHTGLQPHLDGERHGDERVDEVQQVHGGLGHVVERVPVAEVDRGGDARLRGVVERLEFGHRARETRGVALGLRGQAPRARERLQVGELVGQ